MITFVEFRDWVLHLDSTLGERAPSLAEWWELKARLAAVEDTVVASSAPGQTPPTPAADPVVPRPVQRQAEDVEHDIPARPGGLIDPEPADFRQRSRDTDGGLSAEVVDALRQQQADLRPARGTRTPRT